MAKVARVLALLAVMTLVAALPMSVLAQNDAPPLIHWHGYSKTG